MAIPVAPNTTCDIYRSGNAPPAAPDVAGVACFLKSEWLGSNQAGDRGVPLYTWTHIMLIDVSVDIRDGYLGANAFAAQDNVYIPDKNGTRFVVTFIERVQRGTLQEHKRVFLDRQTPNWPSNDL
ncbi:MAG: hypothetical protein FJ303_23305 [Planctomycetes bacterium]|nr:hypothetical protein [Planctomycetota bacterium]